MADPTVATDVVQGLLGSVARSGDCNLRAVCVRLDYIFGHVLFTLMRRNCRCMLLPRLCHEPMCAISRCDVQICPDAVPQNGARRYGFGRLYKSACFTHFLQNHEPSMQTRCQRSLAQFVQCANPMALSSV